MQKREVRAYPIFETELNSIAFLNTVSIVFFSVGSAFISFAIGIWTNAAFAERLTPEGVVLSKIGGPALCIAAALCYGLAIWALVTRRSEWQKIKDASKSGVGAPG